MGVTSSSSSPAIVAAPQRAFLQSLPQRLVALTVAVDELREVGAVPGEQVVLQRRLTAMADAAAVLELDSLSTAFAGAESVLCRDPEGPTMKDLDTVADTLGLIPSLVEDVALPTAETPQSETPINHRESMASRAAAGLRAAERSEAPLAAGSLEARAMALAADAATAEPSQAEASQAEASQAEPAPRSAVAPLGEEGSVEQVDAGSDSQTAGAKRSVRPTLVGFPPAPTEDARCDALAGREVLLAHSDPALLRRIRRYLVGVGVELREATGGEQLWAELQRCSPELLLCARDLPGLDADELSREMERDPLLRDVPTVFLEDDARLRARYGEGRPRGRRLPSDAVEDEVLRCCEELLSPLTQLEEQLIHRAPVWGAQSSFTPHRVLGLTGRHVRHAEVIFQEGELELRAVLRAGRLSSLRTTTANLEVTGKAAIPLLLGLRTGRFELVYEPALQDRDREARVDAMAEQLLAQQVSRVRRGLVWLQGPNLSRIQGVSLDERVVQHCLGRSPSLVGKLAEQLNAGVAPRALLSGVSASVLETVLLDLAARGAVRSVLDLSGVDCLEVEPTFAEGCPSVDLLTPAHSAAMAVELLGAAGRAHSNAELVPSPVESALPEPASAASPSEMPAAHTSALAQLRGSRIEPVTRQIASASAEGDVAPQGLSPEPNSAGADAPKSQAEVSPPPSVVRNDHCVVAKEGTGGTSVAVLPPSTESSGGALSDSVEPSPNALADFLVSAESGSKDCSQDDRPPRSANEAPTNRVGTQRLAKDEGTELGQWVLEQLSEQPPSRASGASDGLGRRERSKKGGGGAELPPEEDSHAAKTTPRRAVHLLPRRGVRRQLEWARSRARSLITQSRALLESAALSKAEEAEKSSLEHQTVGASGSAAPAEAAPEVEAGADLEPMATPSSPEAAVPSDFPDQGMDCPRLVERQERWRIPRPVAAAALPVLVLSGTAAAGYAVMEGLQERLPLIRAMEEIRAGAPSVFQAAALPSVGPPGAALDIAPPGSKKGSTVRSAPDMTATTIPLPPGIAVTAGKGLLEVYTADRQRIYVDGVFVGRGPARRVPLKLGKHELVTRTDESEMRLEFEVSEGQRTRIQPALHAANQ